MFARSSIQTPRGINDQSTAAQIPPIFTNQRIVMPSLMIFLGSTPAISGLELMRHLLAHNERDRRKVAMVYIDIDEIPTSLQQFRQRHKGKFTESDLRISVPPGVEFATLPDKPLHTFIATRIPKYWGSGAGGIRNNGHVAAAFNYDKLYQAIESGLTAIAHLDGKPGSQRMNAVQANIVAFLGGGTGGGIVGDVALMVRQMLTNGHYDQRINIFCLLPEPVLGSNQTDIDWRKNNTVASLLELSALSIVAKSHGRVYQRYMLHRAYDVGDQNPLANEIYLIGSTQVGTVEDAARVIGMDLYQRVVDASGVGKYESSRWGDRRALGGHDERGLPRVFGTTCPLSVRFPALDTALAFAKISASFLLPYMVPTTKPTAAEPSPEEQDQWLAFWDTIGGQADYESHTAADRFLVARPHLFGYSDFLPPIAGTLRQRRREYEEAMRRVNDRLQSVVNAFRREQEQRVDQTPPPDPNDTSTTIVGRRVSHLMHLRQEYVHIQGTLQQEDENDPANEWDTTQIEKLEEALLAPIPWPLGDAPDFYARPRIQKRIEALKTAYNYNLEWHPKFERRKQLLDALQKLIAQVDLALEKEGEWFASDFIREQARQLEREGRASPAWRGTMDHPHAHQIHIFDYPSLYDPDHLRNFAIERLYWKTTLVKNVENEVGLGDRHIVELNPSTREYFVKQCTAYLRRASREDASQTRHNEMSAADLETYGKQHLAQRVVDYFTDYYLTEFNKQNLFGLIEIGLGTSNSQEIIRILHTHLNRMHQLTGELVIQEESLYPGGPEGLHKSLVVAMHFAEGTNDRRLLNEALDRVGGITRRLLTPHVEPLDDLHSLQMAYGLHGISLATIPEFYRTNNSMMERYLTYQQQWIGRPMLSLQNESWDTYPHWESYGNSGMPPHASGEMEQMALDPRALNYAEQQPHSSFGTSVLGRIIREPQDLLSSSNGRQSVASYPPQESDQVGHLARQNPAAFNYPYGTRNQPPPPVGQGPNSPDPWSGYPPDQPDSDPPSRANRAPYGRPPQ